MLYLLQALWLHSRSLRRWLYLQLAAFVGRVAKCYTVAKGWLQVARPLLYLLRVLWLRSGSLRRWLQVR